MGVRAQIKQGFACATVAYNITEGGVEAAIGIEPHNPVVRRLAGAICGLGSSTASDKDPAVALVNNRPGLVITVGAQIKQRHAVNAKAGVEGAVSIQSHHPVVEGIAVATGGLGIGIPGNQNLAVAPGHHRPGLVNAVEAEIQDPNTRA